MKKLYILIFIISLSQFKYIYGQSSYAVSPEATAMGKFIEYPVSNYTGVPNISIPIYEIKMKDFSLPISLNYHAKGVLVSDLASDVGLGWNLNAGGMITRAVRNHPDDHNKNHQYTPSNEYGSGVVENFRMGLFWSGNADEIKKFNENSTDFTYVHNTLRDKITIEKGIKEDLGKGKCDIEPDIFYFSYGGISGQFVFDVSNNIQKAYLLSYQDLEISHTLDNDGRISSFKIADSDGNFYFFEDVENLHRIDCSFRTTNIYPDSTAMANGDTFISSRCDTKYNSAWYLTKIITSSNQIVHFYYRDDEYMLHDSSSCTLNPNYRSDIADQLKTTNFAINIYSSKKLSRIETPNELIGFESRIQREDRVDRTYPISGIIILEKESREVIKSYTFSYSYFNSSSEPVEYDWGNTTAGNSAYTCRDFYSKRLKLDSITEVGIGSYKFYYDTRLQLPHIFSFRQDNWGFFNDAKGNTSLMPTLYVYPKLRGSDRFSIFKLPKEEYEDIYGSEGSFIYQKANRDVNPSSITTGTLTKVIYPTGGYTTYDYEPNQFWYKGENRYGGGIRIKSIKNYNSSSLMPSLERNYQYTLDDGRSSGKILNMPIYVSSIGATVYKNIEVGTSSNSLLGSPNAVGYTQVTISDGYGKTVSNYSCPAAYGELSDSSESGIYKITPIKSVCVGNANYDLHTEPNTSPFPPNPNYDWSRGLLLSEKIYNTSNTLVKEINYSYDNFYKKRQLKNIYGIKYASGLVPYDAGNPSKYTEAVVFSKYELLADVNKVLVSKIEKTYSQGINTPSVKTNRYKYNSLYHMNITEDRLDIGNSCVMIDKFLYSSDMTGGPAEQGEGVAALIGKGMTKLIERTRFIEHNKIESFIGAELTTYDNMPDLARPVKQYSLQTERLLSDFKPAYNDVTGILIKDARYREKLRYNTYDSYGNPIHITQNESDDIIYLWSYHGQYPIAEIRGATYDQVESAVKAEFGVTNIDALSKLATPDVAKLQKLRLNSNLKGAHVTTYTYQPLVGMTTMTDPTGVTIAYEYDPFGRLKRTKDQNGKTIQEYDYHYRNQ